MITDSNMKGTLYTFVSNQHCIEIVSASMPSAKQWTIVGHMHYSSSVSQGMEFSTTVSLTTANPKWNEIFCLFGDQYENETTVTVQLYIYDQESSLSSLIDLGYIVINIGDAHEQELEFSMDYNTIVLFSQACKYESIAIEIAAFSDIISNFSLNFLIVLLVLGFVSLVVIAILVNFVYINGYYVNYFAILWMVLELWDFESDIVYTVYLMLYYSATGEVKYAVLTVIAAVFVIVPYVCNLSYLRYLILSWTIKTAPGYTKLWLEKNNGWWRLLVISLILGSVHPALELCNSLFFPYSFFTMHLPYTGMHMISVNISFIAFC